MFVAGYGSAQNLIPRQSVKLCQKYGKMLADAVKCDLWLRILRVRSLDLTGYIPSKRNWEEGGYEVNSLWEYGHPAERWAFDLEERIAEAVAKLL